MSSCNGDCGSCSSDCKDRDLTLKPNEFSHIGKIYAVVSGKGELVSLTIDPVAVDPEDVEMLQDTVIAAVNEAIRKAEEAKAEGMGKLTGGLNLSGLGL